MDNTNKTSEPEIFERARVFIRAHIAGRIQDVNAEDLANLFVMFACEERLIVIREANAMFVNTMHRRANRDSDPPRTK